MRKKIILSLFIIMVLLTNYSIAANITYTRTGGSSIKNIASVISDDIYVDWKYNATTNRVSNSNIEIYQYNQESDPTKKMISTGSSELIPYTGNENKYSLTTSDWNSSSASFGNANNAQYLFYTIKLPEGETSIRNVATFIYKDGISYDTQKYDVKMNIEEITKTEDVGNNNAFRALIGCREYSADNLIDIATYNKEIEPAIGVTAISPTNDGVEYGQVSGQVEVKVKYYILDKGNEIPISGLFKVADLDQNQGFALKEFTANNQNTYAKVLYDELEYKTIDNNAGIFADIYTWCQAEGYIDYIA